MTLKKQLGARVKLRPTKLSRKSYGRTLKGRKTGSTHLEDEREYACFTKYDELELRCTLYATTPKIAAEDFVNERLIPNLKLNLAPLDINVEVCEIDVEGTLKKPRPFQIVADCSAKARGTKKTINTYDRRLAVLPAKR